MVEEPKQEKQDHQRGGTAAGFIATVKRRTRRRFLAEDKIRIVLEGMKRAPLCFVSLQERLQLRLL